MADSSLLIERPLPGCVLLTLNRPYAKNALSQALRRELTDTVRMLAGDPQARVLILTGAGDAFCAGLDLKELGAAASGNALALDNLKCNPVAALLDFPGPVIGAINGVAIGSGFELALACDVLICSQLARFADTHARVGVLPGWALSQRLSRTIGVYRAKALSLTGDFLSASQAEAWGLAHRVVEARRLLPESCQTAATMLSAVPQTLVDYKRLIDDGYALPYGEALKLEHRRSVGAMLEIDPGDLERRRHAVRARAQQQLDSLV
ncbi:enoyl-CoA hydratase [Paraburkholderia saeva]|uniref:enoyl-CoA hydratase n=1 Tax=Paraburkholderia saeva TaxID=2777537 RepID=UPI001DA228CE|nr:enoyl-CoA hydratase [Paraburkholderia saeva]CAG4895773.1 putative enoyl-CoA hydratase echA8 [Paraburkholderia saeva]